jgi:hypothetical protein
LNIYFCERLFGQVLLIEKNCSRKSAQEKVRKKKYSRKIVEEKVRKENCGKKSVNKHAEACSRKSVVGKVWQKTCGRKTVEEKSQQEKCGTEIEKICSRKVVARKIMEVDLRQQNYGKRTLQEKKRYGSHMCSVEFMNQVEGFPCKYVGFPLGSLWLAVELM